MLLPASKNKLEFLFTREILHLDFTEKLGTSLRQKIMSFHITFAAKNCNFFFCTGKKNCVTFAFFVFHKIVKNNVKEKKKKNYLNLVFSHGLTYVCIL